MNVPFWLLRKKLSLTQHQLEHLINELGGHNELYWLTRMWRFPLSVETCHNLPLYNLLSKIVHVLKPNFSHGLQIWLALYFSVLFSDGFESGDFSAWTGSDISSTVVSIVDTVAHHGTYSMQVVGGDAGGDRGLYYKNVDGTDLYVRAYVKHSSAPVSANQWQAFVRLGDSAVIYKSTNQYWGVRDNVGGWTNHWGSIAKALTTDWMCIELHFLASATVGVYQVWVDGTLVCEVTGHNTGTTIGSAAVGMFYTDDAQAANLTINYDCVVAADAYIGPEAPPAEGQPYISRVQGIQGMRTW